MKKKNQLKNNNLLLHLQFSKGQTINFLGEITFTSPKVPLNDTDTPCNFVVDTDLP
jgi:hypothetical protein